MSKILFIFETDKSPVILEKTMPIVIKEIVNIPKLSK